MIERSRLGEPLDTATTLAALLETEEVKRIGALGPDHGHPMDIELAAEVDRFDFTMEVTRDDKGLRLDRRD